MLTKQFSVYFSCVLIIGCLQIESAYGQSETISEDLWSDPVIEKGKIDEDLWADPVTDKEKVYDDLWSDPGSIENSDSNKQESTSFDNLWVETPPERKPDDWTFSGDLGLEYRYYFDGPATPQQHHDEWALKGQLKMEKSWNNRQQSLIFSPYFSESNVDEERGHIDIREALYLLQFEDSTFRMGIGQVFWGVTETRHLVDIINQSDLVENQEHEEKLGQLLLNLTHYSNDWGTFDLFILPGFRERTFPGLEGRFRSIPRPTNDKAAYESSDKDQHVDYAARWSKNAGSLDLAISYFNGTSREPLFYLDLIDDEQVLVPYYYQIEQFGLELLYAYGDTLLKFEGINRSGQGDNFHSLNAGVEHIFSNVLGSGTDISLLAELLEESRDLGSWDNKIVANSFSNAAMLGLRYAKMDATDTEGILSIVIDRHNSAKLLKLELSRRLTDQFRIEGKAINFYDIPPDDPNYTLRRDGFIQIDMTYFF